MFQQLKWSPFNEIVKFKQFSLVYKAVNGNAPEYRLCLLILKTTQIIHSDLQPIKNYSFLEHIINPYHTYTNLEHVLWLDMLSLDASHPNMFRLYFPCLDIDIYKI